MKNDVIDVEVKDVQIEQFLTEKKELVLNAAQRTVEAYLEVGKHLKEVNERLATFGVKSRWKAWLEEVGFNRDYAHKCINVYDYATESILKNTDSIKLLQVLSAPSNDPEKVALVEQKLASGEKMTVAQVKEVLKKMPEPQREAISQASYELDEEERTGMTIEEIQADHKRADDYIQNKLPVVKAEMKEYRKEVYQEGLDKMDLYVTHMKDVQQWLFKIIENIPVEKQPPISKEALMDVLNIVPNGACVDTEILAFIDNNINTY